MLESSSFANHERPSPVVATPTLVDNPSHDTSDQRNGLHHHHHFLPPPPLAPPAFPHQKMIIRKWGSVSYSSLKPSLSPPPTFSPHQQNRRPGSPLAHVTLPKGAIKNGRTSSNGGGDTLSFPIGAAPSPNRHAFVATSRFDPFSFEEDQFSSSHGAGTTPLTKRSTEPGATKKRVTLPNGYKGKHSPSGTGRSNLSGALSDASQDKSKVASGRGKLVKRSVGDRKEPPANRSKRPSHPSPNSRKALFKRPIALANGRQGRFMETPEPSKKSWPLIKSRAKKLGLAPKAASLKHVSMVTSRVTPKNSLQLNGKGLAKRGLAGPKSEKLRRLAAAAAADSPKNSSATTYKGKESRSPIKRGRTILAPTIASATPSIFNSDISAYTMGRMRPSLPLLIPIRPQTPSSGDDVDDDDDDDTVLGHLIPTPRTITMGPKPSSPSASSCTSHSSLQTPPVLCSVILPRIDHILSPLAPGAHDELDASSPNKVINGVACRLPFDIDTTLADDVTDLKGIFFGNTYIDLSQQRNNTPARTFNTVNKGDGILIPNSATGPSSKGRLGREAMAIGRDQPSPTPNDPFGLGPSTLPPFVVRHLTDDKVRVSTRALCSSSSSSQPPISPVGRKRYVRPPTNSPSEYNFDADPSPASHLASSPFVKACPTTSLPGSLVSPTKRPRRPKIPAAIPPPRSRSTRYGLRSGDDPVAEGTSTAPPDGLAANLDKPAALGTPGEPVATSNGLSGLNDSFGRPTTEHYNGDGDREANYTDGAAITLPVVATLSYHTHPGAPPIQAPSPKIEPLSPPKRERKYFVSKNSKAKPTYNESLFNWDQSGEDEAEPWTPEPAHPNSDSRLSKDAPISSLPEFQITKPVRVKGVKQAYQCHEYGEVQDLNDDVEYLLAGLKVNNSTATKCLSVLGLANKCLSAPFLAYIRARGIIMVIYRALWNTAQDANTAICTAALFFVLSFDKRMQLDADPYTLDSIVRIHRKLATDPVDDTSKAILAKNCLKIRTLFSTLFDNTPDLSPHLAYLGIRSPASQDTHQTPIDGQALILETLNNLVMPKKEPNSVSPFKAHMRENGAEDIILDAALDLQQKIGDYVTSPEYDEARLNPDLTLYYQRLNVCISVIGNLTTLEKANQAYLEHYKSSKFIIALIWTLRHCIKKFLDRRRLLSVTLHDGVVDDADIMDLLISSLRVLLDITHDNEPGALTIGLHARDNLLYTDMVNLITSLKCEETVNKIYDLLVLALGFLVNVMEKSHDNCRTYMEQWQAESVSNDNYSIKELIRVFFLYLDAAAVEYDAETYPTPGDSPVPPQTNLARPQAGPGFHSSGPPDNSVTQLSSVPSTSKDYGRKSDGEAVTAALDKATKVVPNTTRNVTNTNHAHTSQSFVTHFLQKAGRHMEYSLIASYIALFLGCLIHENREYTLKLKELLPPSEEPFAPMINILHKYLKFIQYSAVLGLSDTNYLSIKRIVDAFELQKHWY